MPKGPRGESRPADLIGCAVAVANISIGEAEDDRISISGRYRSGLAGGRARSEALSSERKSEIAALAAKRRWG